MAGDYQNAAPHRILLSNLRNTREKSLDLYTSVSQKKHTNVETLAWFLRQRHPLGGTMALIGSHAAIARLQELRILRGLPICGSLPPDHSPRAIRLDINTSSVQLM